MDATVAVELSGSGNFEGFFDELTRALARRGLEFDCVKLTEPARVVVEWRATDWDPDDVSEVELRVDDDRIRIELRGFGKQFWSDEDGIGWFADEVAAGALAAATPQRFGDWLTDRSARRPFGIRARRDYQDPTHHRPSFGAVLSALSLTRDDVLLELACGGGAFLEQALHSGCRAVGLDHSVEMVQAARELNAAAVAEGRLELMEGDVHELPFADGSFTAVTTMQAFFFFADPQRVLAECHRVLRRSGRLAVFTVSEAAKGTPAAPEPMASRGRFYTDEELVELARGAGFQLASVSHPDLGPFARAAGLPDDIVALFTDPSAQDSDQLLLARKT